MAYSWISIGLLVAAFLSAAGLAAGTFLVVRRTTTGERLDTLVAGGSTAAGAAAGAGGEGWTEVVNRVARPIAALTQPSDGWETSALRRRFIHAGWRDPSAPTLFFAAKVVLGIGLPAAFVLAKVYAGWALKTPQLLVGVLWLMAAGYFVPNWLLNRRIAARQRDIFESFPDALDLLTIAVEAGLGLDAAMARVGREIRLESPALADELELVTLEMRAGAGKERALRNLALRTGVEDIESLVALLVQSERFGTSIGESLRIQSDTLRFKRQQRAEELAAKISVKLVFPLVLCILPSIFIVVGGPAVLQIGKTFGTVFGGQ